MREEYVCDNCGAHSAKYWHRLSPGLVTVLIKFRRAIRDKGANSIHLQQDMYGENELTKTEYANAQKLRYFGLIHHETEAGKGYWLLTKRGRHFLDGDLAVPRSVQTMNNKLVGRSPETVTVRQATKVVPQFDDYAFWHATKESVPVDFAQVGLAL